MKSQAPVRPPFSKAYAPAPTTADSPRHPRRPHPIRHSSVLPHRGSVHARAPRQRAHCDAPAKTAPRTPPPAGSAIHPAPALHHRDVPSHIYVRRAENATSSTGTKRKLPCNVALRWVRALGALELRFKASSCARVRLRALSNAAASRSRRMGLSK